MSATCAEPQIAETHARLYANLASIMGDPHRWVVDRAAVAIERYVRAFKLLGAVHAPALGGRVGLRMNAGERDVRAVILVGGKGTRMGSDLPKVLHELRGRSLIHHAVGVAASG